MMFLAVKFLCWCLPEVHNPLKFSRPDLSDNPAELNRFHLRRARDYFQQYHRNRARLFDFSITIMATNSRQHFLMQNLGYLLDEFRFEKRPYIEICLLEADGAQNAEILESFNHFNVSDPSKAGQPLSGLSVERDWSASQQCLLASDRNSPYVLLLQETAGVLDNFAELMQLAVIAALFLGALHRYGIVKMDAADTRKTIVNACCLYLFLIYLLWLGNGVVLLPKLRYFFADRVYLTTPRQDDMLAVLYRTSIIDDIGKCSAVFPLMRDYRFTGRSTDFNLFAPLAFT
ncbi:unnamed protein product, partial [Mesorhabditis spiculigera]